MGSDTETEEFNLCHFQIIDKCKLKWGPSTHKLTKFIRGFTLRKDGVRLDDDRGPGLSKIIAEFNEKFTRRKEVSVQKRRDEKRKTSNDNNPNEHQNRNTNQSPLTQDDEDLNSAISKYGIHRWKKLWKKL